MKLKIVTQRRDTGITISIMKDGELFYKILVSFLKRRTSIKLFQQADNSYSRILHRSVSNQLSKTYKNK